MSLRGRMLFQTEAIPCQQEIALRNTLRNRRRAARNDSHLMGYFTRRRDVKKE